MVTFRFLFFVFDIYAESFVPFIHCSLRLLAMSQPPFPSATAAAAAAIPVPTSAGGASFAGLQTEAGMEDEPQGSASIAGSVSSFAASSSPVSASDLLSFSLLAAAPIAAAAAAALSAASAASAPAAFRVPCRRPLKLRTTTVGDFFKPGAQRVEAWTRRKQEARTRGAAADCANLKSTKLADFFPTMVQYMDRWSSGKRAARVSAGHADTTAELASVNQGTLQSLRLDKLRLCFQLDNETLGLPHLPTKLLQLVNEYCAPQEGFRRLVGVAVSRTGREWNDLWVCSEAEFRNLAKYELLDQFDIERFMEWRADAWATWDETIEAPLAEAAELAQPLCCRPTPSR